VAFDAVLIVSFGGPQGVADIRPFLDNVLRGRRIPPHRIDEVARHYEHFGGISPLTELTYRQAEGLRSRLAAAGVRLPVYVGMRNWHPYLVDTLRQMSASGVRHAIGFIAAAQHSYSSCGQYRENVADARAALRTAGQHDVEITYVGSWFDHELFIETNAAHIKDALVRLPNELRARARLIFTAHSLPTSMADVCRYREQLQTSASRVAERVGMVDWTLVYQSRSGRPEDPWLEPDICDYLRHARTTGLAVAVLCPIGFICDHIEVLWDLDHDAAQVCRDLGVTMVRAEAANADPRFIDMMADVVLKTIHRYDSPRPLPIAATRAPRP
jgi:protoporphyrin/coproporphyrin ferrochelatase